MNKIITKIVYILILTSGLSASPPTLNLNSFSLGACIPKREHCVLFDVSEWKDGDRVLVENEHNKNCWFIGEIVDTQLVTNNNSPEQPFICCKINLGLSCSARMPRQFLGKYLPPDYNPN